MWSIATLFTQQPRLGSNWNAHQWLKEGYQKHPMVLKLAGERSHIQSYIKYPAPTPTPIPDSNLLLWVWFFHINNSQIFLVQRSHGVWEEKLLRSQYSFERKLNHVWHPEHCFGFLRAGTMTLVEMVKTHTRYSSQKEQTSVASLSWKLPMAFLQCLLPCILNEVHYIGPNPWIAQYCICDFFFILENLLWC